MNGFDESLLFSYYFSSLAQRPVSGRCFRLRNLIMWKVCRPILFGYGLRWKCTAKSARSLAELLKEPLKLAKE